MLKFSGRISATVFISLISVAVNAADNDALMKGKVATDNPVEINIVYDKDGDVYLDRFKTGADGSFSYSADIPADEIDVMMFVDGIPFGAHLEKGKTLMMNVEGNSDAVFSGDNAAESDFYSTYTRVYYPMEFKPTPDSPFVFAEYKSKLDKGYEKAKSLISKVSSGKRDFYTRLNDTYYNATLLTLYSMDSYDGNDHTAEIDSIMATIDPNSEEARLTGILSKWYSHTDAYKKCQSKELNKFLAEQFAAIDGALTSEANKKSLWYDYGAMFMMYGPSDDSVDAFLASVESQLSKAPNVKERILEIHEAMKPKVKDGDALPYDPVLISPEGSRCKLSDLLGKRVVYIDIWATWCGPCCREIPYMEKVVAQFKGNDAISFISISSDNNRDAWLKKLGRDKPEWPQYIFEKSSGDEFMDAMGISGIPRFLLIGKNGRFISTDAERPSNENIADILNAAAAQ